MAASVAEPSPPNAAASGKVARYTVRPCARTPDRAPRVVVLVPPSTALAEGFAMARERLARGEAVRLVGAGVTLPRVWPDWAADVPGLWLTELTAYRRTTRWQATGALRDALRALTDELFDGAFPGLAGSDVLYPQIGMRAFAGLAFVMPTALGLAEHHAGDEVTCTRRDWPGFGLYRALVGQGPAARPLRRARWSAHVAPLAAAGWAASLLRLVRTYVPSRVGLRELRRRGVRGKPAIWMHLFPDVARINEALIRATGEQPVGALLHGHIGPGERPESNLASRRGRDLWPGLRSLDESRVVAWGATSAPATAADFARSCVSFTKGCAVATVRLCRRGPLLDVGGYRIDLTAHTRDLAKLLTMDLGRACVADAATRHVIGRLDMAGSLAISAGALAADVAVTMRRLHAAGATTVDFAHGWSGEPAPFTDEPPCDYRCVWAQTDAGHGDTRFLVGGMLVPERLPRAPSGSRPRVLLMSNYVHRDDTVFQPGLDGYLEELLDVVRLRSARYEFRWRPHPADRPDAVSRAAAGLDAEVSRGRPLAEDLAWADAVISTISTATLQAMLLDLPTLVHLTPDVDGLPITAPFSPERTFFYACDGAAKVDAVLATRPDDPDRLAPERRARAAFFGESLSPRTLAQAVSPLVRGARR